VLDSLDDSAAQGAEDEEGGLGARAFLFLLAMPREPPGIMPSLSGLGPGAAPSLSPVLP
jgi:hypothetical protein